MLGAFAVFITVAVAHAQVTITEGFQTSNPTGWSFTNSNGNYTPASGVYVRATRATWLQLTNNTGNEANAAVYTGSFNSAGASVYATFSYEMYGGTGGTTIGGDGITFFLYDASQTFSTGAYGGSLGYAQKTGINGMNGGYLGVGLDAYGNYSAASEGRIGGYNGTTQPVTESVAVRGPGQGTTGYDYLGGTGTNLDTGANIDQTRATTTKNTVQILLSATNQLTVTLAQGTSTPQTVLQMDLSGYARPDLLSFGFTAGTGAATDNMLINNLTVSTLQASKWTNLGGTGNWGLNTNWDPNVVPTAGSDILLDNSTVSSSQTIDTGANRTIRSLAFDAPFDYTINNNTVTIDAGTTPGFTGIAVTQTHGTGVDTVNSNLALNNAITVQNNATGTLALNGAIANGGNKITFSGSGNGTVVNGAISGSGGIEKDDTGIVTLAGANTYTGGTTINSGTVNANSGTALGGTGAAVTLAGGTLASTNGTTINNTISLTGDASMANITSAGTLTQTNGNRILDLSNATQSGNLNLSNNTTNRTLTLQVDSGTSNVNGVIANGGGSSASGITKTGAGTLVLGGANTYSGATTISNGILQLGASDRIGNSSAVRIDASGTFDLNGFSDKIGALTALNGGATIDFGPTGSANTLVFGTYTAPSSGVLVINNWENGTDNLGTTGGGQNVSTVYLSGYGVASLDSGTTNLGTYGNAYLLRPGAQSSTTWQGTTSSWNTGSNWSGNTVPTSSQVAIFDATGVTGVSLNTNSTLAGLQFSSAAQSYTISGTNTLTLSGTVPYIQQKSGNLETIATGLTIGGNTVMDITGSGNLALSGNISGASNLVRDGTGNGKLILSGSNGSFTGNIYVNTGILQAASSGSLGSAANTSVTVAQGATLELASSGSAGNAMNIIGTGVGNAGAIHNLSGSNTLSGTLTQGGDTTISADSGSSLALSGTLTGNNTTTTFAGAGNITTSQITNGTGGVVVNSTGTVTLGGSASNTYSGDTTVNSGTLALAKSGGATAVAGNLVVNGGSVLFSASNQIANTSTATLNGSGALNLNGQSETLAQLSSSSSAAVIALGSGTLVINGVNSSNSTYAGTISGTTASNLNVTGTGKVYLSGNNSGFAGNINVSSGTLNASGSNSALGTGTATISSGGNLQVQGGVTLANSIIASGTGTSGNGVVENLSGNNTLLGTTTLSNASLFRSDSGTFTISGAVGLGANTLTVGGASNTTIGGTISGTGGITKDDAGTLTLSGTNSYSGNTNVGVGTVVAAYNGALGTGSVNVSNGATLQMAGGSAISNSVAVLGTGVSGTGAINNASGGNTISGTITLGGATRVQSDAGSLSMSGSVSIGSNTLTVGGAGNTVAVGVVSGSGGITKVDSGTLTLAASNTYTGTTSITGGTLLLDAANAISNSSTLSLTGGTLSIGATNALDPSRNLTINNGTTLSLATSVTQTISGLTTTATSTVNLGAGAVLTVNRGSASTLNGTLSGTGTLAYTGGGSLTLSTNLNYGGILAFGGTTIGGTPTSTIYINGSVNLGTLHITGDTVLDFGNSTATSLNASTLIVDSGVNVSVVNWVNMTDYFIAQNFPGAVPDQRGNYPVTNNASTQITFNGYTSDDTQWLSYDHEITPAPEPAVYGLLFMGAAVGLLGLRACGRRFRAAKLPRAS